MNSAILSASCGSQDAYVVAVERADAYLNYHTGATEGSSGILYLHLRNVPKTCSTSGITQPCHAVLPGQSYFPSLWYCRYVGPKGHADLGPFRTNLTVVAEDVSDVVLPCPVPNKDLIVEITGFDGKDTVLHVNVTAAHGEAPVTLPYMGVSGGDALLIAGWDAPPPPPPPPPPLFPPPPAMPPGGNMLKDPRCYPARSTELLLQLEDDRSKVDVPDTISKLVAGVTNDNFAYIGNDKLNKMDLKSAEICMGTSGTCAKTCWPLHEKFYATSAGGKLDSLDGYYSAIKGLDSKLKKMIACFAGACQCTTAGACNSYSNHWFYDSGTAAGSGITAAKGGQWEYDGRDYVRIGPHPASQGATVAWHTWGSGRSFYWGKNFQLTSWGGQETGYTKNLFWIRTVDTSNSLLSNPRCYPELGYDMILQLEDDRSKVDVPDTISKLVAGVTNDNFAYIGNDKLNKMDLKSAEICMGTSGTCAKTCWPLHEKFYATSAGGKLDSLDGYYSAIKGLDSKLKKMIACFAGACQCTTAGACNSYSNHWFYDSGTAAGSGITAAKGGQWEYDGRDYVRIGPHPASQGATVAWHTWGSGRSFYWGKNFQLTSWGGQETGYTKNLFWIRSAQ